MPLSTFLGDNHVNGVRGAMEQPSHLRITLAPNTPIHHDLSHRTLQKLTSLGFRITKW
jgi:hypothetical protein